MADPWPTIRSTRRTLVDARGTQGLNPAPATRVQYSMVSGFLDWFEENKVGIIGTLTLHTGVLFTLTLMSLRTAPELEKEILIPVEVMPEAEVQELVEQMIRKEMGLTEKVTNLTSNITAQTRPYINQQRLSESVQTEVEAQAQAEFDRLAQERMDRGETAPVIPELDPSKWNKELYMDKAAEPMRVEGATTVWHDLKDRVRGEGVPGYLCRKQGRVAVKISVARDGTVEKAEFDNGQSFNADDCMLEHALRSAKGTRFNASGSAPDPQVGTVYFIFVQQ